MPDDELSAAELQQLKEIAQALPVGHPAQKKVNLLLNSQPTQFERDRSGGGVVNALKKMVPSDPTEGRSPFDPKFWFNTDKSAFDPTGPGTLYSDLTRPLPKDLPTEVIGAGRTGGNAIYRGASVFAPLAGVSPEQMEESSARGDTSGVATQAAVPAATAIAAPMIKAAGAEVLRRSGNTAASTLRYPATARQSQIGRPGTISPFLPSQLQRYTVPDWVIPKGEVGTPTNPGPFMEIPAKMPKVAAPVEVPPELGSPENPGWMSKIPNRMPKPPVAAPSPFLPGSVPTNVPVGAAELPPVLEGSPTPFPRVEKAGMAAATPRIVSPNVGEPRFTGNEGRPATWRGERVAQLAGKGVRPAIEQQILRGEELPPNARYIMGDPDFPRAVYNPRSTTQFTPEGEPIRNIDDPTVAPPRSRIKVPQAGATPRETINAATGEVSPYSPGALPQGNPTPFAPPGTVMPPESSASSASPIPPPSSRWTGDPGAMPGEPSLFLDGGPDTAKAAIVEVQNPDQPGRSTFEARLPNGELLGKFGTAKEAASHAEKAVGRNKRFGREQ